MSPFIHIKSDYFKTKFIASLSKGRFGGNVNISAGSAQKKEKSCELLFFVRIKGLDRLAERGEAGIPLKIDILHPRNPHNNKPFLHTRRVSRRHRIFFGQGGSLLTQRHKKRRITTQLLLALKKNSDCQKTIARADKGTRPPSKARWSGDPLENKYLLSPQPP